MIQPWIYFCLQFLCLVYFPRSPGVIATYFIERTQDMFRLRLRSPIYYYLFPRLVCFWQNKFFISVKASCELEDKLDQLCVVVWLLIHVSSAKPMSRTLFLNNLYSHDYSNVNTKRCEWDVLRRNVLLRNEAVSSLSIFVYLKIKKASSDLYEPNRIFQFRREMFTAHHDQC